MIKALYDWMMRLGASPRASRALVLVSFLESSVFPLPPDLVMIPMILARPARAWRIASLCTVASVLGGALGYLIGWKLFTHIGQPLLAFYGHEAMFAELARRFNAYGVLAVLIAGVTPFPYKVITIFSGVTGLPFVTFMLASLVARGARFFVLAALLWHFGPPIRRFVERRLGLMFTLFALLLAGGLLAIEWVE